MGPGTHLVERTKNEKNYCFVNVTRNLSKLKDLPPSRATVRKVVWRQFVVELKEFCWALKIDKLYDKK